MCNSGVKFNKLRLKGHMFNMGSVPIMLVKCMLLLPTVSTSDYTLMK